MNGILTGTPNCEVNGTVVGPLNNTLVKREFGSFASWYDR